MRESVIYQEIYEDGMQAGIERGIQEGLQAGIQQGLQEAAVSFVTRQLTRRVGALSPELDEQIRSLSLESLEDLGEALLDFTGVEDLVAWLRDNESDRSNE